MDFCSCCCLPQCALIFCISFGLVFRIWSPLTLLQQKAFCVLEVVVWQGWLLCCFDISSSAYTFLGDLGCPQKERRMTLTIIHWTKQKPMLKKGTSVFIISVQAKVAFVPNPKPPFRILSSLLSITNGISLLCGICSIYSISLVFVISASDANLRWYIEHRISW